MNIEINNSKKVNYFEKLKKQKEFEVIIMGKDPYPTAPNGIPFCKDTWEELCADNCCGKSVLNSLGFNLELEREKYKTPIDFFLSLIDLKIGFLNLIYSYNNGKSITRKWNIEKLNSGFTVNEQILNKAKNIVLCGEAKKLKWMSKSYFEKSFEVVHPDNRNKISYREKTRTNWSENWAKDSLKNKFNL